MRCPRCGGLMVHDQFYDARNRTGPFSFWGQRCLNCGEILDAVISQNRMASALRMELVRKETFSLAA